MTIKLDNIKLDNIKGIGKRLKEKILNHFPDESKAINALKSGMGGIIYGISQKKGIEIARSIFEYEYNARIGDVLKTEDVLNIYGDIIKIISEYFITDYSRNKISLYFPLGKEKTELIKDRYKLFGRSLEFVKKYGNILEDQNLLEHLQRLSLLKREDQLKKVGGRCILTDSKEVMEYLKDEGIDKIISCELISEKRISEPEKYFKAFADTFKTVLFISDDFNYVPDLMNLVIISPDQVSTETVIPEKIILRFSSNAKVINSIHQIAQLLKNIENKELISEFLDVLELEKIENLQENTKILDENGSVGLGYDNKLDIYREDAKNYAGYIVEIENLINDVIKKEINNSSITIQGEEILNFFKMDASIKNIRDFIPPEVDDLINESIEQGIVKLEKRFHLTAHESDWISDLYPEIIEVPVSLNPVALDQLEFNIKKRAAVYNYNVLREIAEKLKKNQDYLEKLIWVMLEFEFFYGVGKFAKEYRLSIPEIVENNNGIILENSHNLYLMEKTLKNGEKTVPITYTLGDIPFKLSPLIDQNLSSRLNLLSGSNSGGKSMCILTIAHSLILAQMGFPAPGKIKYNPFSEIYFFKKSRGQISAGAFESTLLMFVDLAQSSHKKIILADELEAITEPNAAAKVIAAIFSLLLENSDNYAVFVTHLVEMLLNNLSEEEKQQIRVDGIEARGLDEELELIVDRSPIFNFIARSTPELILERLSKKSDESKKRFFRKVLLRFNRKSNANI
ncbi:MAG: hypothetical protein ACTSWY_10170 [Promethearchaeota archaeon]